MSFDIFLQSFEDDQAAPGEPQAAWRVLEPFFAGAPSEGHVRVYTADGGADVYGVGSDAVLINHASGQLIWQLMVEVAEAAGWVVMPAGCPVCVVREEMISDLPADLRDHAVVVRSGADVQEVIAQA